MRDNTQPICTARQVSQCCAQNGCQVSAVQLCLLMVPRVFADSCGLSCSLHMPVTPLHSSWTVCSYEVVLKNKDTKGQLMSLQQTLRQEIHAKIGAQTAEESAKRKVCLVAHLPYVKHETQTCALLAICTQELHTRAVLLNSCWAEHVNDRCSFCAHTLDAVGITLTMLPQI